ncbi:MAG: DVU_1556 family methyltransferase [Acidimicrobiia bacterium]
MSGRESLGIGVSSPLPPLQSSVVKSCCADLWAHPAVRLLAGEALRPGGLDLTGRIVDRLGLAPGAQVLDVGCGPGSTLGLLADRGLRPQGIDFSPVLAQEAARRAPAAVGDGERLPYRSGSFDAALMECVLSAIPDKQAALGEVGRVLRPNGYLALSDVTLTGPLPEPLDSVIGWIACAAGALSAQGYALALEAAGFEVEAVNDQAGVLDELVGQARRRLALLQGALGAGILSPLEGPFAPELADAGQALLGLAAEAVGRGDLGYAVVIGRRR